MPEFTVEIVIENKPAARDPEGQTVQKDLINRGGYNMVTSVRSGKYFRMKVIASDETQAKEIVYKLSNDLRIFNPIAHVCSITVKGERK
ncbi:MAG: phosphoribosylformylglycinamidine synthase subunit PurS [Candidatus Helarchaeota archaeon]